MRRKTFLTWLRFGRRKAYPWKILVIAACDYVYSSEEKQERAKVNFLATLWKLDTPKIIDLINDLFW